MVLPSQMPRSSRVVATPPARRKGPSNRTIGVGLMVIGLAGAGWWYFTAGEGGAAPASGVEVHPTSMTSTPPESAPTQASSVDDLKDDITPATTLASMEASKPMPPTLTMGSREPSGAIRTAHATNTPVQSVPELRPSMTDPVPVAEGGGSAAEPLTQPGGSDAAVSMSPSGPSAQPTSAPALPTSAGRDPAVERLLSAAQAELASNRWVEARSSFNRALHHPQALPADQAAARDQLAHIAATLTFSPQVTEGDAMVESYAVQAGDSLVKIAKARELGVDWRFIQRLNGMSDPGKLRLNQKLKLVRGPFHAVVHKDDYRLDLYADAKDAEGNRMYLRSFAVGLGEFRSTPLGAFAVREGSRLINPHWVNPRTGEKFHADDPKNPIGERWIGLVGTEPDTEKLQGYGIHGTVEPDSIGQDRSMGCIRMLGPDVELIYELLAEKRSTVLVIP